MEEAGTPACVGQATDAAFAVVFNGRSSLLCQLLSWHGHLGLGAGTLWLTMMPPWLRLSVFATGWLRVHWLAGGDGCAHHKDCHRGWLRRPPHHGRGVRDDRGALCRLVGQELPGAPHSWGAGVRTGVWILWSRGQILAGA